MITVLYVDDEPDLLMLAQLFLEQSGEFSVRTSASAGEVLASTELLSCDAIVSDYQMPGMNGIEFLKAVRERSGTLPFILFTGRGREEVVIEAINNGADFYLQKGGEPTAQFAELATKIRYAVLRRQAEQEVQKKNDELNATYEQIAAAEEELRQQLEELIAKQEALKDSEEKFRAFTENIPDLTTIVDVTGMYKYISPSVQQITGWRAEDLLGKKISEIDDIFGLTPDDIALLRKSGHTAMQKPGAPVPVGPFRVHDVRGATLYIEGSNTFLPDVKGIQGIVFHGRDITDRVRAEEELRRKNEELTAFDEELSGQFEELARNERQIRENEAKFRGIFEQIHDALILFTESDGCIDCNRQALELYGFPSKEEFLGLTPADVSPSYQPDGQESEAAAATYLRTVRDTGMAHFEWTQQRKDGSTFPADILLSAFELDGKQVFLSSVRDVTERKWMDDELQLLKISVDRSSDEVFWMDYSGTILYANDAASRVTGYSHKELCAMKIFELDPDFPPDVWERSVADLRERKTQFLTTRHRCKNGTVIDVEIVAVYVTKDNREYSFAFVRDITERKRIERAIADSEERYRTLIENANEAIVIVQDWQVVFANSGVARFFGIPAEQTLGTALMEYIWPDDRQMIEDNYQRRCAGENIPAAYDFRVSGPGGRPVWVSLSVAKITWNGKPATLNLMTDITARKDLEQAIREANRRLNLLSSITRHDVANQLTMLQGYTQLAALKNTDPVVADFLAKIGGAAETITRQIGFTKAYQELGVKSPGWFRLNEVIAAGATAIRPAGSCRKIELFADPMIERVFFNLFDNARQHGGHVTEIAIRCEQVPDGLLIVVEDNGVGIAPEEKEKIFDKGYGKNSGFGLFLVREILAITGITIRETGYLGAGARFEITVPKDVFRVAAGE